MRLPAIETAASPHHYSVWIGPGRKLRADLLHGPEENESGAAFVLHTLPPHSLAAPPHRHTREDEYSFVVEGELTVWEEGRTRTIKAGECVAKRRDLLHTFWNEGEERLRFIEIIHPGEFAHFFEEVDRVQPDGAFQEEDIRRINQLNEKYGLEMKFEQIPQLMQEHGLQA